MEESVTVRFRVGKPYQNADLAVYADGALLRRVHKRILTPGEMEQFTLRREELPEGVRTVTFQIGSEMNIRELTCIGCPMGCQLRATLEDGVVTAVTGNTCPRGDAYARKECVHPERTVTGTVRVLGGPLPVVPVRTQGEVPKEKVLEVARALHHAAVPAPVQAGQVVLADVCGTGVAVVATKNIG